MNSDVQYVSLDGQRRRIRFDDAAVRRLATIPGRLDFSKLSNGLTVDYAFVVDLVWAMLVERSGVASPAELAEKLPQFDSPEFMDVARAVCAELGASFRGPRRGLRDGHRFSRFFKPVRLRPF